MRFAIRFDPWVRGLFSPLFIAPASCFADVGDDRVDVKMGWAFRASFPRTAIAWVSNVGESPLSRGVHGWAGRWLVNGSGDGIVAIHLTPDQRAYVAGFPVSLRHLWVSVEDDAGLRAMLSPSHAVA